MTKGTPNCKTFAVIAISEIPPGATPSINATVGSPETLWRRVATPKANKRAVAVNTTTTIRKRGAVLKNPGRNLSPSPHPTLNCAALDSQSGIAENSMPPAVIAIVRNIGPNTHAAGMFMRVATNTPIPVSPNN